ncbi:hypothetical protein LJC53_06120 [Bacteroidales bacterium OttesenSCG-928-C03]|nr:hypothetical protein [Bacteroidales bacterium OttesenSCG-928-E04]MDL2309141.1 hypothetical protein [Bacteroidales bacterium OttesenSCG-928-C03]
MEQNQRGYYNSFSLLQFIWKWKYPIIILCVVTAVLSYLFSTPLFVTPKFRSTAIIYAPRTNSISKILMNEQNYNERLDMKAYAVEEETEQMMQILNSRDIQDALIAKFNLGEHYKITPDQKYYQSRLYKTLIGNIKIKRTEYGAISITVIDKDPQIASDMANEIVAQLDVVKGRIERERATAAYNLLTQQLIDVTAEIKRVDDSLKVIMEHGVFDFETQSERVMQQYAIAISQGNTAAVNRLQAELDKLATWGPQSEALRELQYNFREYQAMCKAKMMDAKVDMEANIPLKFEIEKAIPADKKFYPKKLVVMLVSTVSVFILAIFVLLVIENIKSIPVSNSKREEETI